MTTLRLLVGLFAISCARYLHAAGSDPVIVVAAADDERIAAVKTADRASLEAILSNELRYAHSSGKVDTKESFISSLTSHRATYERLEYKERTFLPVAPGVILMSGRVVMQVRNEGRPVDLDLNFLAVWREENGKWRFLAWQSCRNAPASLAAPGR